MTRTARESEERQSPHFRGATPKSIHGAKQPHYDPDTGIHNPPHFARYHAPASAEGQDDKGYYDPKTGAKGHHHFLKTWKEGPYDEDGSVACNPSKVCKGGDEPCGMGKPCDKEKVCNGGRSACGKTKKKDGVNGIKAVESAGKTKDSTAASAKKKKGVEGGDEEEDYELKDPVGASTICTSNVIGGVTNKRHALRETRKKTERFQPDVSPAPVAGRVTKTKTKKAAAPKKVAAKPKPVVSKKPAVGAKKTAAAKKEKTTTAKKPTGVGKKKKKTTTFKMDKPGTGRPR